jgi:hypothetical protein
VLLFYNTGEAKCSNLTEQNGSVLTIAGWHVGYERFRKGFKVFRQIKWNIKKRSILIADWVEGIPSNEMFELKLNFLVNPLWSVKEEDEVFIFGHKDQTVKFGNVEGIRFGLGRGLYCPSYQVEAPCQTISAACKVKIGEKIHFSIYY